MSNNYHAPPPPHREAEGCPQAPYPGQQQYPGQYGQPPGQQPPHSNKMALFIILGAVAAVVVVVLVAVFAWVIPTLAKPQGGDAPSPAAAAEAADESAAPEESESPSDDPTAGDAPAGAIPLPPGWAELQGPAAVPAEGDPLFNRFVTGESSFQYPTSWTLDDTFGITTDPTTGSPMQQKAQGTEERDGDGIALAYAFFAEAEEGKYGKEPEKVQAAIKEIEAKFKAMPAAELPQHLVGHRCTSNFETTTPEIREFRRTAAVVIGFTCLNARGETIKAVNLFSVTPWGTPQMVGVSGHATYWDENPEQLEQIANSYRANRWKLEG
ncbi:MAG TPA: hypothetical protein VJ617_14145 [Arthrobacter sp.]|nr:hypothetical protein [Arthrobacter sp.]